MLKHALIVSLLVAALPAPHILAEERSQAVLLDQPPGARPNDPQFQDPTNAALVYSRAWLLLPQEVLTKATETAANKAPDWAPDAELRRLLLENQTAIQTLIRASRLPAADFGVEYSAGIGALLPHLTKMRPSARLLAADAHRAVADHQPDEAAGRVAAIYGLSTHCTSDRLLISALVSIALDSLAISQTEYLMITGTLTDEGRGQILAAANRFPQADPFGVKAAVWGERHWCTVWIREQCKSPDGARVFTQQILPLLDGSPEGKPENVEDMLKLRSLDQPGIMAELDKADRYYTDVISLFDAPDAAARLKQLGEDVASGKYGLIARHVVPAMSKAYESNAKAIARHADTVAKLRTYQPPAR